MKIARGDAASNLRYAGAVGAVASGRYAGVATPDLPDEFRLCPGQQNRVVGRSGSHIHYIMNSRLHEEQFRENAQFNFLIQSLMTNLTNNSRWSMSALTTEAGQL
jgi:hypothetical protein